MEQSLNCTAASLSVLDIVDGICQFLVYYNVKIIYNVKIRETFLGIIFEFNYEMLSIPCIQYSEIFVHEICLLQ